MALLFMASLNCLTAVPAVVGNALILNALRKCRSLHPPSKALLSGLALTDLGIGLLAQPTFAHYLFALAGIDTNTRSILHNSIFFLLPTSIFLSVSVLTVTTIAIDRYLALYLRERYQVVVTQRRIVKLFVSYWILSIASALLWLWHPTLMYGVTFTHMCVCIFISSFAFVKVTLQLRGHQVNQARDNSSSEGPSASMGRYKKSVETMTWVYAASLICYLPECCALGLSFFVTQGEALTAAILLGSTLVHVSASVNPIVYCWRIREIRQTVRKSLTISCCH